MQPSSFLDNIAQQPEFLSASRSDIESRINIISMYLTIGMYCPMYKVIVPTNSEHEPSDMCVTVPLEGLPASLTGVLLDRCE